MEAYAHSAMQALIKLGWDLLVQTVLLLQSLYPPASSAQHANVTLGIRAEMGTCVRSVVSTNTKQDWVLLFALIVNQTLSLHLAAPPTQTVSARQGTRVRMEQHARSVVSISTKQAWGRQTALIVHRTLSPQLAAS